MPGIECRAVIVGPPLAQCSLARCRLVSRDQPIMFGKPRQCDLQNDLPCPRRPPVGFLSLLEAFQLAADIDQDAGDLGAAAINARMTRSLAAITSSRSIAGLDDAPRRTRSRGAKADQFEVTRGLI